MPANQPETEIAVIKTQIGELTNALGSFMKVQGEENKNLRDAMLALKDSMAARGRLSAPVVISLLAFLTSFAAIFGGFVHFYVSSQVSSVDKDVAAVRVQGDARQQAINALTARVDSEELRSRVRDAEMQKDIEYLRKDVDARTRQP